MTEKFTLYTPEEYTYPAAFGFIPNLRSYIHEDETIRPTVIVVPGGGYRLASPTEAEIVAKKFYGYGYQTFVLTYTTDILGLAPLKDQPMQDLARAIRFVREHASEFKTAENQIAICGFSAGAHLCGSVAVHYEDLSEVTGENEAEGIKAGAAKAHAGISCRPDAVILSYPVITSGEFAHRDSFTALYGPKPTEEELEYSSLEKQVTGNMPPVFMWQTVTDASVPVENSMLMAKALKDAGVFFAYHLFPQGKHGLSLSDDDWANANYGEPYTLEPLAWIWKAVQDGSLPMPEEAVQQLKPLVAAVVPELQEELTPEQRSFQGGEAVKEVAVWPDLADAWLQSVFEG